MISLNKLRLEAEKDKIFGVPKEMASKFFETNDVTFTLPVSGDVSNLKIDFASAATQVMSKALQGKFGSESFTRRVSENLGKKIGDALNKIFSKLL